MNKKHEVYSALDRIREITEAEIEMNRKWLQKVRQSFLKNISEKDTLEAAKPAVKKMFGIPMMGYLVKRDADITYVFWFTKQGSPTIEGQFM
ncbi:hypothetical protein [Brevibacillus laterosporus]|uniref:hypothetical protein n=1 Tax=Brevibacillus laterosporus TaxID=1465 RepID=UPI000839BC51|nr:hypothetical protein [Brevibacillus laterosporus]